MYIHSILYIHTHIRTYTCTYVHTYTHIRTVHTYVRTYTHTYIHTSILYKHDSFEGLVWSYNTHSSTHKTDRWTDAASRHITSHAANPIPPPLLPHIHTDQHCVVHGVLVYYHMLWWQCQYTHHIEENFWRKFSLESLKVEIFAEKMCVTS